MYLCNENHWNGDDRCNNEIFYMIFCMEKSNGCEKSNGFYDLQIIIIEAKMKFPLYISMIDISMKFPSCSWFYYQENHKKCYNAVKSKIPMAIGFFVE